MKSWQKCVVCGETASDNYKIHTFCEAHGDHFFALEMGVDWTADPNKLIKEMRRRHNEKENVVVAAK